MRTNKIHALGIFVLLLGYSSIFGGLGVYSYADDNMPDVYCQITVVTMEIFNTGAAGDMTGVLEYNPNYFEIINYSNLPSASIDDTNPYNHVLSFDAGVIGGTNGSDVFTYSLVFKTTSAGEYDLTYSAYLDSNPNDVASDLLEFAGPLVYPVREYVLMSEEMQKIVNQNTWDALLPVVPLSGSPDKHACNPELSRTLYIENGLTFDIPEYCFYGGEEGSIIMGNGSVIVVNSGSSLHIEDLTIGSCIESWQGIYVKSGGKLTIINSTISNAQYAIIAEKGSTIRCSGTIFLDNYISIVAPGADPGTVDLQLSYNSFLGSGSMLPPFFGQIPSPSFKPLAGIYVNNSTVTIQGNDVGPAHQISGNHFYNLTNGIIAKNSITYIGDQRFSNIQPDPNIFSDDPNNLQHYEGYGVLILDGKFTSINGNIIGPGGYDYHFEDCRIGIHCKGGQVLINGMTMGDVTNGIELARVNNRIVRITENTIDAKSIGILSTQNVPFKGKINFNTISILDGDIHFSTGIELNDIPVDTRWDINNNYITIANGLNGIANKAGNSPNIHENTIDVFPLDGAAATNAINLFGTKWPRVTCNLLTGDIDPEEENFRLGAGINIDGSNSFILSCNTVEKFRFGIKTSSESTGDNFIQGNALSNLWVGLYYGYSAITGNQLHRGNTWDGDFYYRGAIHNGDAPSIINSRYFYDSNDNSLFEPPSVNSAAAWFYDESGSSFLCDAVQDYCVDGVGSGLWAPSWDSLDLKLTSQSLGLTKFNNSMTWKSRFWIYRRLHNTGSLPTGLSTFISNNSTSKIGLFSNAHDSLAQAFIYSGTLTSFIEEYPINVNRLFSNIAHYDSLIVEGFNFDSLNILRQEKMDTISLLDSVYLLYDEVVSDELKIKHQNAIDYIEAITTDSIWEEALKFTLLEYLLTSDSDTLVNSTDIFNLATSCPDQYGDAVYYARSLIRKDSLLNYYDDEAQCSFLSPRSVNNLMLITNIFPNPGDYRVEIHSGDEIGSINVFDITGLEFAIPCHINETTASIETHSLPSGLYIVRVVNKKNGFQIAKMSIVH